VLPNPHSRHRYGLVGLARWPRYSCWKRRRCTRAGGGSSRAAQSIQCVRRDAALEGTRRWSHTHRYDLSRQIPTDEVMRSSARLSLTCSMVVVSSEVRGHAAAVPSAASAGGQDACIVRRSWRRSAVPADRWVHGESRSHQRLSTIRCGWLTSSFRSDENDRSSGEMDRCRAL
jgi:hypothetical protein